MPKKKRGAARSLEEEPDNIEMEIRTSSMAKATTEKAKAFLIEGFKQFKVRMFMPLLIAFIFTHRFLYFVFLHNMRRNPPTYHCLHADIFKR